MSCISKIFIKLSFLAIIILLMGGCFNKKNKSNNDVDLAIDEDILIEIDSSLIKEEPFLDTSKPFYPLQETIDDIQLEMSELRIRKINLNKQTNNQLGLKQLIDFETIDTPNISLK